MMKRDGIIHEAPLSVLGIRAVKAQVVGGKAELPRSQIKADEAYLKTHGIAATEVKHPSSRGGSVYRTKSGTLRYGGAKFGTGKIEHKPYVPQGKYKNIGGGNMQMDQGGYTSPGDIKKYQKGKLPAKGTPPRTPASIKKDTDYAVKRSRVTLANKLSQKLTGADSPWSSRTRLTSERVEKYISKAKAKMPARNAAMRKLLNIKV